MNRSLNVLYMANLRPDKLGSIEEHALFLSRELNNRGHKCFLGFIDDPIPELTELLKDTEAEILTINCGNTPAKNNSSFMLKEVWNLRKIVTENKIDIVHINFMGITNPLLLGIFFTKAKVVFTEHASGSAPKRKIIKHWFSRWVHFLLSHRISYYIAVSDFVHERLKISHHAPDKKTITTYNGVNVERFFPAKKEDTRHSLNLSESQNVICTVAMLVPEKGVQHVIEAVSIIKEQQNLENLTALIVGEGPYQASLEDLTTRLGVEKNVVFLGRRSDVHSIIVASDVVVVPSLWEEAFGLIVAEAMSCERPLIASRTGGITEQIKSGVNGILTKRGNSLHLAESITSLIQDPVMQATFGKNGREIVKERFNLELQVKKHANMYESIINN